MKTNTDMNPIDRLNDDGQKDFPKSLVGKLKKEMTIVDSNTEQLIHSKKLLEKYCKILIWL